MDKDAKPIIFRPNTGTALAVLSGLSFFMMCMTLPLVGPAGSRVEHALQNQMAFILILLVTLSLSLAAAYSKLGCRKRAGGPLPWFSFGLCAVCVLTFVVLLAGGLAV